MPDKSMYGLEYKFNFLLQSLGKNTENIRTHFNYTYTNAKYDSERSSNATARTSDKVGDIAEHKANLIFDADLFDRFHWNMRINYVGEKETTVSNPVEKVDPYFIANVSLQWRNLFNKDISLFFNVNNLLDEEYYHPGLDNAGGGEDISRPSRTWYSSRLPQPERNLVVGISSNF